MKIVTVDDADLAAIEGDRCRVFGAASQSLTAQAIFDDIRDRRRRRVIVICNTVSQAQGLFGDLKALDDGEELGLTLLHSRFLPEDRARKEAELKWLFDRDWRSGDDGVCRVLISTQVIEVGLNITCEVMHVQLCPMNALLQRAGRCARFAGERGEVWVYYSVRSPEGEEPNPPTPFPMREGGEEPNPPTPFPMREGGEFPPPLAGEGGRGERSKKQKFLPYNNDICELTWQVLLEHSGSERASLSVGFRLEEAWINRVHAGETVLEEERRQNNLSEFEQKFNGAFFRGDKSAAGELIRCVDSRSVFVWEEPIFIDDDPIDPRQLRAFSVPVSLLFRVWWEFRNLEYKTDWVFKRIENPKGGAAESYSQPVCLPIASQDALVNSVRILVNPRYVHYDDEVGLLMGLEAISNGFVSPKKPPKSLASEYRYEMDTYVGHLVLMWKCWREGFLTERLKNGARVEVLYAGVREELLSAGGRFIRGKIFTRASREEAEALFEILVFFAVFIHDLGKLQVKWQQVMGGWQAIAHASFGGKNPGKLLLAHTDYDPTDKRQKDALKRYEDKYKRPNHAVESAFLAQSILKQSLIPLLQDNFDGDKEECWGICQAVVMAAGRHHSAWTSGWKLADVEKLREIRLHPEAKGAIASSWRYLSRFLPKLFALQPVNLDKEVYRVRELDFNQFGPDRAEYQQLYALVVRGLRLCDGRSVQHRRGGKNIA